MVGAVNAFVYKDLARLHRLGLGSGKYSVAGAGGALSIRWYNGAELQSRGETTPGNWVSLVLSSATGTDLRLYLQESLFHTLLQEIEPAQFWQLAPRLRCACLQVYNRGALDWISRQWQCPVTVKAVDLCENEPDYAGTAAFALSSAAGINYLPGLLELDGIPQRYPLSALFDSVTSHKEVFRSRAPLRLDVVAGSARLPLAQIRELQRNDLILPEPGEFSLSSACLRLQGRPLFLAEIEQGSLRVKQLLRSNLMADTNIPPPGDSDAGAQDSGNASNTDSGQLHIDPGEIDVAVDFSLGALSLTLAEIEAIGEGHIFELSREPGDCVDIKINGKRLARGEPVLVGDRVGIRIVKIDDG